jgi:hypothetical protein
MSESQLVIFVVAILAVCCFLSTVGLYTLAVDAIRLYRRWRAMR